MSTQYVGIDLHRKRSVIVRMTPGGEVLETVRIENYPIALSLEVAKAGESPEVVLEATYGSSGTLNCRAEVTFPPLNRRSSRPGSQRQDQPLWRGVTRHH